MIAEKLTTYIQTALKELTIEIGEITLEHPTLLSHGDYSTNCAMVYAQRIGENPRQLAEKIVERLLEKKLNEVSKIEIAGPGFINFHLSRDFFTNSIEVIDEEGEAFGTNKILEGEKVIIEYTDPNPFKEFHIGHLMSNTIGESLSRIIAFAGAETKRACYQGDVGVHVAKTMWALLKEGTTENLTVKDLARAYTQGSKAYEEPDIKKEIDGLNKVLYEKSDEKINTLYEYGRKISLQYFEEIYKKLGTQFDFYFLESETGGFGKELVTQFLEKGVFEKGEGGAVVFRGEKYDPTLHTRVFVNAQGLPTYEAKELGLASKKYEIYPYTKSIVVTGNEINDYFRVLLGAMKLVFPELAQKTVHISHGMLRLPTGKMSSRTGDVITGESLLGAIGEKVSEKVNATERGELSEDIINQVSVAALKYSVLRQATGKDIIFDFDKSLSFEGDSGPYLQYSYARALSVVAKAHTESIDLLFINPPTTVSEVEKLLYRFPEVVISSLREYSPQYIATYLIEIARAFNAYYAEHKIVDPTDATSGYKVALSQAFATVMKNGLYLLGIPTPEKM
jgi:arginyl-tRNA synthetase